MTVAAQFAAEALDLPIEKMRVRGKPDTDLSPYDWQTVASRQTWATGNAVLRAAEKLKAPALRHGRRRRSACPPPSSSCADRQVVAPRPSGRACRSPSWSWATSSPTATPSAARWPRPPPTSPRGCSTSTPRPARAPKPVAKWTFGAQGVEVAVDPETGQYHGRARRRLLRRRQGGPPGPHPRPDLRRHRAGARHRDDGGAAARREDRAGSRNASLMDYKIPTHRGPAGGDRGALRRDAAGGRPAGRPRHRRAHDDPDAGRHRQRALRRLRHPHPRPAHHRREGAAGAPGSRARGGGRRSTARFDAELLTGAASGAAAWRPSSRTRRSLECDGRATCSRWCTRRGSWCRSGSWCRGTPCPPAAQAVVLEGRVLRLGGGRGRARRDGDGCACRGSYWPPSRGALRAPARRPVAAAAHPGHPGGLEAAPTRRRPSPPRRPCCARGSAASFGPSTSTARWRRPSGRSWASAPAPRPAATTCWWGPPPRPRACVGFLAGTPPPALQAVLRLVPASSTTPVCARHARARGAGRVSRAAVRMAAALGCRRRDLPAAALALASTWARRPAATCWRASSPWRRPPGARRIANSDRRVARSARRLVTVRRECRPLRAPFGDARRTRRCAIRPEPRRCFSK